MLLLVFIGAAGELRLSGPFQRGSGCLERTTPGKSAALATSGFGHRPQFATTFLAMGHQRIAATNHNRKDASMASKQIQRKQQVFSITAPTAASVMLAGDFTQWQEKPIQLKKEATGVWRASVELTPGTHRYRF